MNQALLIIDIQNDYFPGGRYELFQSEQAAQRARLALEHFRALGLPVIHVQHISLAPGAAFFVPGTGGAGIHESVTPLAGETVIVKHAPNAFFETGLSQMLKDHGIDRLVVCGMMSHMCVDTTVRAARDHGLSVTLLWDACATRDLEWQGQVIPAQTVHGAYMAALDGRFARVVSTEEFLKQGN